MNAARPLPAPGPARMSLANIVRGKQARPLRVLVHGVEGVGKSTFGADAPGSLFLCAEDGTSHLDVARLPHPRIWADVMEAVRMLSHEEHPYRTLVIDTLDWLEPLVWQHVCQMQGKQNIEDLPYGKGYVLAVAEWRSLLAKLDNLVRNRRMNVIMLAHSHVKRVDAPDASGAYDRYQMKVHDKASSVLREWCDALLFARHEVRVVERNGKQRGQSSGHRVLHTTWSAAYDAKNRFDLPETLPLSWADFEAAVSARAPADAAKLRAELVDLIAQFADPEKRAKASEAMRLAGDDAAKLARYLDHAKGVLATQGEQAAAEVGS